MGLNGGSFALKSVNRTSEAPYFLDPINVTRKNPEIRKELSSFVGLSGFREWQEVNEKMEWKKCSLVLRSSKEIWQENERVRHLGVQKCG